MTKISHTDESLIGMKLQTKGAQQCAPWNATPQSMTFLTNRKGD